MKLQTRFIAVGLAAFLLGACAFAPTRTNLRLDEARLAHSEARADLLVAQLSPGELRRAEDAMENALAASNAFGDPAVVDHLAYVAKQRFAIAREAAKRVAAERRLGI